MKLIIILLFISLLSTDIHTTIHSKRRHQQQKFYSQVSFSNVTESKPISKLINIIGKTEANISRIVLEQNQDSEFTSKDKNLDYEKPCQLKQGYLANIVGFKQNDISLKGQPVFSVLNTHNIAFFENENVNSLVYTIELSEISQVFVPKFWSQNNLFCFQIINGPLNKRFFLNQTGDFPLNNTRASLCAASLNEMVNWIKAIKNLLIDCNEVKEVQKSDSQLKVKRKNMDNELIEYENKMVDEIYSGKANDISLKKQEKDKQDLIKVQFGNILSEVEKQKLQEQNQINILEEERKQINEKTETLKEEKECLKETLDTRRQEETKISEILIKEEEEKSEESIIKSAKDKILYAQQNEFNEIRAQEEQLKKEAIKKQEKFKKSIINEIVQSEKELDPSVCYASNLKTDPIVAMKKGCQKLINPGTVPDVKKIEKCMYKSNYCNICCNYFIGVNHAIQREVCKQKCRGLLLNEVFEETQYDYIIKVPNNNKITALMKKQANSNQNLNKNNDKENKTKKSEEEEIIKKPEEEIKDDKHIKKPEEEIKDDKHIKKPEEEIKDDYHIKKPEKEIKDDKHIKKPEEEIKDDQLIKKPEKEIKDDQHIKKSEKDIKDDKKIKKPEEDIKDDKKIKKPEEDIKDDKHIKKPEEQIKDKKNPYDQLVHNVASNIKKKQQKNNNNIIKPEQNQVDGVITIIKKQKSDNKKGDIIKDVKQKKNKDDLIDTSINKKINKENLINQNNKKNDNSQNKPLIVSEVKIKSDDNDFYNGSISNPFSFDDSLSNLENHNEKENSLNNRNKSVNNNTNDLHIKSNYSRPYENYKSKFQQHNKKKLRYKKKHSKNFRSDKNRHLNIKKI